MRRAELRFDLRGRGVNHVAHERRAGDYRDHLIDQSDAVLRERAAMGRRTVAEHDQLMTPSRQHQEHRKYEGDEHQPWRYLDTYRDAARERAQHEAKSDRNHVDNHVMLGRSEEHTSELQSHLNLVCRLLLEKKKKIIKRECTDQNHSSEIVPL